MWENLFKRDQFFAGIIFGILLPVVFFVVLYLIDLLVLEMFNTHMLRKQEYLFLLSIAINLFAIKYYFVNLNYDKTGRGILIVTFALTLLYFLF